MPRYFFHILDQGELVRDEEGTLCPSFDGAIEEAKASARDLARQEIARGQSPEQVCVEIHDERGRILGALSLLEVVRHPSRPKLQSACDVPFGVVRH